MEHCLETRLGPGQKSHSVPFGREKILTCHGPGLFPLAALRCQPLSALTGPQGTPDSKRETAIHTGYHYCSVHTDIKNSVSAGAQSLRMRLASRLPHQQAALSPRPWERGAGQGGLGEQYLWARRNEPCLGPSTWAAGREHLPPLPSGCSCCSEGLGHPTARFEEPQENPGVLPALGFWTPGLQGSTQTPRTDLWCSGWDTAWELGAGVHVQFWCWLPGSPRFSC